VAKNDCLINFVLDRSGSMSHLTDATIEGFNGFCDEQRNQPGRTLLSLTLFDTAFDVRYVAQDLSEMPAMARSGPNAYGTNGGTALYDAVGTTVRGTEAWLDKHPDFKGRVVCVILTDGEENSSHEWNLDALNRLISEKRAVGWDFVFLGAGQAAWTEGQKFTAIPATSRVAFASTSADTLLNFAAVADSLSVARSTGGSFTRS